MALAQILSYGENNGKGTRENDFDTIYAQMRNNGLTFASRCYGGCHAN
jgi:hypothetical protein